MIAANFDNLLLLLLVVVGVLFQLLAKLAGKKSKGQTTPPSTSQADPPRQRAPRESNEDPIRKLLEALGQPPTSRPPPTVVPRTNIPPRPLAPVQPPMSSLSQLKRDKPRKREPTPKESGPAPLVIGGEQIAPRNVTSSAGFDVHKGPSLVAAAPIFEASAQAYAGERRRGIRRTETRTDIAVLLASSSGLRDAVLLREILGPPRGLHVIDASL